MRIKLVLATGALLGALACGDAQSRPPMSDGERLYEARCTACHAAYEPSERTPDDWKHAVAKMERWKKVTLSPEERALILSYLSGTEAKLPSAIESAPAPSAGAASVPRG